MAEVRRTTGAAAGDVWARAILLALLIAIPLGAIVRGVADDEWWALPATMATILVVAPLRARWLRRDRADEPPPEGGRR